jgi:hypothetical protein
MTGAEARGNAQPDFAALNPAGAPLMQQQQRRTRIRARRLRRHDDRRHRRRAQVTKPVLYDHFSSKQTLFLTVLESIRDGLIAKGRSIVEAGGDLEQRFRLSVDAFLEFVEREPEAARVLLTVPSGDAAAAKLSRKVQAGASAGLATLFHGGKRAVAPARRDGVPQGGPARCRDKVARTSWPFAEGDCGRHNPHGMAWAANKSTQYRNAKEQMRRGLSL